MISTMKPSILLAIVISLTGTACKLDLSSAAPNANANANSNQATNESAGKEQKGNCPLTISTAPVLKGLRLGMTPDEVLALFPGSQDDAEIKANLARPVSPFGVSELIIRPGKFESKDRFAGISHITFGLLDGRVASFTIGYNGPAYSSVDQFVTKLVEGTSFPPADQWQVYPGMETQLKTLQCQDFEVRVFSGGEGGNLNYVLMRDLEADKKLKDRRAKARAKLTPTPK